MAYTHTLSGGEKYKTNYHNHALLGMSGCDITEENGKVTVDFSRADMSSVETNKYMDVLRNSKDMACSSNGRQLTVTGKAADFRSVANIVAQTAVNSSDKLGARLVGNIQKQGTKIEPHAALRAFGQTALGVKPKGIAPVFPSQGVSAPVQRR